METIISKIRAHEQRFDGFDKLYGYINKVYGFLEKLPAGKTFTVAKLAINENIALFTEIVKLYICETNKPITFIRDDYKQFRKQP
ncbi:MAG: hypothetical protein PF489_13485 [Salinivirgaceae bacterium]|nr:hypothetical protein [Salinivirgaceae bacterium]